MFRFTAPSIELQCIYPRQIEVEKTGTWFSEVVPVDIEGKITVEIEWSDDMNDPTSQAYQDALARVQPDLLAMFEAAASVLRANVEIVGFEVVTTNDGSGLGARKRRSTSIVQAIYSATLQVAASSPQASSANVGQAVMTQVSSTGQSFNSISASAVANSGSGATVIPPSPTPDYGLVTVSHTGSLTYQMDVVPGEVGEMSQMTISPLHGIADLAAT